MKRPALFFLATGLALSGCSESHDDNKNAGAVAPQVKTAPITASCKEFPTDEDAERKRDQPIAVPAVHQDLIASGVTALTIAREGGGEPICIDISWEEAVDNIETFAGDRYVGFEHAGYESYGYTIVDRRSGEEIATGAMPIFSPRGRRFAAAETSGSGFGNFNDLGVWEAAQTGTKRVVQLPEEAELVAQSAGFWTERWAGEDCVVMSYVGLDEEQEHSGKLELKDMPRQYVEFRLVGGEWKLDGKLKDQACAAPTGS